jgi:hypothetical protein
MANLDYTGSSAAGAYPESMFHQKGGYTVLHRRMKVSEIIAADATMTTNGYIATNDVIYALHVPEGFSFNDCAIQIITPCTASVTVDVGLAGGAEMLGSGSEALDAAAGTWYRTLDADTYDFGHIFADNDTVDVQFKSANCAVGDFDLFVVGEMLYFNTA